MSRSRGARVLRGLAAACTATFVALLSHLAAGGVMPGPVGIIVPLLGAVLVCVALAGGRLSLWRLSLSVLLSQALFHVLFVLGAGSGGSVSAASHAHGIRSLSFEPSGVEHSDISMWAAHVLAAAATVVLLYRGERTVRMLLRLCAQVTSAVRRGVLARVAPLRPVRRAETCRLVTERRAVRPLGWDASSLARRGPPASLRSRPRRLV